MTNYAHMLTLLSLLLSAAACSSDTSVDIGDGSLGQELSDYAASWEGYVEAFTFSDGSDRVRVTVNGSGQGTLVMGEAPAPVTSPRPQGFESDNPFTGFDEPFPGFAYSIHFATVEASRLRFRFNTFEPMADFCGAQTSYQWEGGNYGCVPETAFRISEGECSLEPEDEPPVPVDCFTLGVCQSIGCRCAADGCTHVEPSAELPFALDAALKDSGHRLEGTLELGATGLRPVVRLTRQ